MLESLRRIVSALRKWRQVRIDTYTSDWIEWRTLNTMEASPVYRFLDYWFAEGMQTLLLLGETSSDVVKFIPGLSEYAKTYGHDFRPNNMCSQFKVGRCLCVFGFTGPWAGPNFVGQGTLDLRFRGYAGLLPHAIWAVPEVPIFALNSLGNAVFSELFAGLRKVKPGSEAFPTNKDQFEPDRHFKPMDLGRA